MGLADRTPPTAAEYAEYRKRFSNWGRWGKDDELGTLNFIDDEVRRAAAALVREGRAVSLSRPLGTRPGPSNPFPAQHLVSPSGGGLADYLGLFIHGFAHTHIDALCHLAGEDGVSYYNGGQLGAYHMPKQRRGTVEHWRHGIATRGVLYDIPRLRGSAYVEPGAPVHGWELQDAAAAQGVTPRRGDAVCIRSGYAPFLEASGEAPGFGSPAGVHASVLEFLYETEAALLVWDMLDAPVADQGIPNPLAMSPVPLHVHHIAIPYMGLPLLDNADLEALGAVCAELGRHEFQLVVAPLVIEGGTGSPVNPIALL